MVFLIFVVEGKQDMHVFSSVARGQKDKPDRAIHLQFIPIEVIYDAEH